MQKIQAIARSLNQHSETALSFLLLVAGVVIIIIALSPTNKWVKALLLAYIILP